MRRPPVAVALVAALTVPAAIHAQAPDSLEHARRTHAAKLSKDRLSLDTYLEWEDVQTPKLSPDGRQVIYTRRWIDKLDDRWESSLWIMDADGASRQISQTEEFYQALKLRKVPTAMIRFNDEWHGTSSRPSNFMRTQLYLRSWFDRYAHKGSVASVTL